jgi:hypothetical protein
MRRALFRGDLVEDLSPSAIGLAALTQGVSFLYAQAGELLKARRKAKETATEEAEAPSYPELAVPDDVFLPLPEGTARARTGAVELVANEIRELRGALLPYAEPDATDVLSSGSTEAFEQISRLRDLLESVYGTRISFRGEDRPTAAPTNLTQITQYDGIHVHGNVDGSTLIGRDSRKAPSKKR